MYSDILKCLGGPSCKVGKQITPTFMGPTWGPPGSCRPQMGPTLAPWTLLSGCVHLRCPVYLIHSHNILYHMYVWNDLGYVNTRSAAKFREITAANLDNAICSKYIARNSWKPEQGKIYNCHHCACSSACTASCCQIFTINISVLKPESHGQQWPRDKSFKYEYKSILKLVFL